MALSSGRSTGEGALVAGWITLLASDDPLALASLEDAIAQAYAHGSMRALAPAVTFRGLGRLWTGQLDDAVADGRRALRMAESGRVDMDPLFGGAYLADALLAKGDTHEAEVVLLSGVDVASARTRQRPSYYAMETFARLRKRQGRYGEPSRRG